MIQATIGQIFLNAWNAKEDQSYSPREFFDKVFFRLFYDHPKYMQWITNAPFVQGLVRGRNGEYGIAEMVRDKEGNVIRFDTKKALEEYIRTEIETRPDFLEMLDGGTSMKGIKFLKKIDAQERNLLKGKFHEKVNGFDGKSFDGSIAIGLPASDEKSFSVTSGMVSDMKIPFTTDQVYLSWIGNGLSVGTDNGYNLLFKSPEMLLCIAEGWELYRDLLNDPAIHLTGKQISAWNGQWLNYRLSSGCLEKAGYETLSADPSFFNVVKHQMSVSTIHWHRLFLTLSQQCMEDTLFVYAFSIGKTNRTLGFIPFCLNQGRLYLKEYLELTGAPMPFESFENVFDKGFDHICQYGFIGLPALEPQKIKSVQAYEAWTLAMNLWLKQNSDSLCGK